MSALPDNVPTFSATDEGAGPGPTQVARVHSGPQNPNRISTHVKPDLSCRGSISVWVKSQLMKSGVNLTSLDADRDPDS